jgi:hypothetical protein
VRGVKSRSRSAIGRLLKVDRVLPGESREEYEEGLAQILKELAIGDRGVDAYLVELVYDALWWLKRNSEVKAALVTDEMVEHLADTLGGMREDPDYFGTEIFDEANKEQLNAYLSAASLSLTSLRNLALVSLFDELRKIDEQSELMHRNLSKLQGNLEQWLARAPRLRLLKLEIEQRERNLSAIEGKRS